MRNHDPYWVNGAIAERCCRTNPSDMSRRKHHVRFVPQVRTGSLQQTASLVDNLVGDGQNSGRHFNAERARRLKVYDEIEFAQLQVPAGRLSWRP
jgi:hypothetical protein